MVRRVHGGGAGRHGAADVRDCVNLIAAGFVDTPLSAALLGDRA